MQTNIIGTGKGKAIDLHGKSLSESSSSDAKGASMMEESLGSARVRLERPCTVSWASSWLRAIGSNLTCLRKGLKYPDIVLGFSLKKVYRLLLFLKEEKKLVGVSAGTVLGSCRSTVWSLRTAV